MTDTFIQIAPDSTGQKVDGQSLLNGTGLTVFRQSVTVSDPANIAAIQTVRAGNSAPTAADGAAVVVLRPDASGSTGMNWSGNAPAWPNIGSNFGGSGPFASWFLLATVAASARLKISVDNMSDQQILCLRDDGTAANGAAPVNATGFLLNPKTGTGPEGGHFESTTFRGRLQVFGVSSSQFVAVSTD